MKRSGRLSYHICRIILGAFFVYAGVLKVSDPPAFAGQVAAYQILPYQWNYFTAATLPWVEMLCGGLLIINQKVRPASLVVGVLTLVFIFALGSVVIRGLNIDCGCFGPQIQSTPQQALLRNFLILALAHFVFHLRNKYSKKETEVREQQPG